MSNFLGTTVGIIVIVIVVPVVVALVILALRGITRSDELANQPREDDGEPEAFPAYSPPKSVTQPTAVAADVPEPVTAVAETVTETTEPTAESVTAAVEPATETAQTTGESLPEAYCVRCREKRPVAEARYETTSRGRHRIVGRCTVCDSKVTQFVKSPA